MTRSAPLTSECWAQNGSQRVLALRECVIEPFKSESKGLYGPSAPCTLEIDHTRIQYVHTFKGTRLLSVLSLALQMTCSVWSWSCSMTLRFGIDDWQLPEPVLAVHEPPGRGSHALQLRLRHHTLQVHGISVSPHMRCFAHAMCMRHAHRLPGQGLDLHRRGRWADQGVEPELAPVPSEALGAPRVRDGARSQGGLECVDTVLWVHRRHRSRRCLRCAVLCRPLQKAFHSHEAWVRYLTTGDSQIVMFGVLFAVRVWDLQAMVCRRTLPGPSPPFFNCVPPHPFQPPTPSGLWSISMSHRPRSNPSCLCS